MIDESAYGRILSELKDATLVAVSKTKPVEDIKALYDLGQRDFGENYVQELTEKYEAVPKDIRWHFIGHLQSNKVKYIAPFVHLVHGVDSFKLLQEISKHGLKNNKVIDVLLQVHIAEEETKFGLDEKEVFELLEYYQAQQGALQGVRVCGLMGMASNTEDEKITREEFRTLKGLFDNLRQVQFLGKSYFNILSVGMSSDYRLALEYGSTMVRIGSLLFGNRS